MSLDQLRPPVIYIVGCGGIGSKLVDHVVRLCRVYISSTRIVLIDPDTISSANLERQQFHTYEVDSSKAGILARRYRDLGHVSHLPIALNPTSVRELFSSPDGESNIKMVTGDGRTGPYYYASSTETPWFIVATDNLESRRCTLEYLGEQSFFNSWVWISLGCKVSPDKKFFQGQAITYGKLNNVPFSPIHPFDLFPNLGAATGYGLNARGEGCGVSLEEGIQTDLANAFAAVAGQWVMSQIYEKGYVYPLVNFKADDEDVIPHFSYDERIVLNSSKFDSPVSYLLNSLEKDSTNG